MTELKQNIEQILKEQIISIESVSGGDVNRALKVETIKGNFFVKYNSAKEAKSMFNSEMEGLLKISELNSISVPNILALDTINDTSYLILDFIESGQKTDEFWTKFGRGLANMHKVTSDEFGFVSSNFIGSLPQNNAWKSSWGEFYITQRLEPQLKLAFDKGKLPKSVLDKFDILFTRLNDICPQEPPSLIHGDLWGGNFLVDSNGNPYLIDPSVSYSHREMDIAMTMLFGRFSLIFYDAYNEVFPLEIDFSCRVEIYQLYYLLVHVNLFGGMYPLTVTNIINKWV